MASKVSDLDKPALEASAGPVEGPISTTTTPVLDDEHLKAPRTRTRRVLRTIQRYVWDDPDRPKDEKWFLFKLDVFLL
ncbi:hypothetical protein LTS06_012315, partial [Exophiala xenobiotica]